MGEWHPQSMQVFRVQSGIFSEPIGFTDVLVIFNSVEAIFVLKTHRHNLIVGINACVRQTRIYNAFTRMKQFSFQKLLQFGLKNA